LRYAGAWKNGHCGKRKSGKGRAGVPEENTRMVGERYNTTYYIRIRGTSDGVRNCDGNSREWARKVKERP
jgi:hypothetical protein